MFRAPGAAEKKHKQVMVEWLVLIQVHQDCFFFPEKKWNQKKHFYQRYLVWDEKHATKKTPFCGSFNFWTYPKNWLVLSTYLNTVYSSSATLDRIGMPCPRIPPKNSDPSLRSSFSSRPAHATDHEGVYSLSHSKSLNCLLELCSHLLFQTQK